jgi:cellulose synthase/poly-beta-1,6-N-acetylglucosamine synthase-like glycosyltransferase
MTADMPTISVVVPAYNAAATIAECVRALNEQTVPRTSYEVIVVDDGSTDATAAIAARCGAAVLTQPNAGPAAARNAGVAAARGSVVLFTDADCAPAPDWMAEMLAPLADPQLAGLKGVYRTYQKGPCARFVQLEYQERYDHTARCPYVDLVDTYAAGYRREVLLASGGFDRRFRYLEDQELSFRLADAGYRMAFAPHAAVYHRHPESWRSYAQKKVRIGYWKTWVLRLHPGKARIDSHTPLSVKLQMGLAALSAPLALLSLLLAWGVWLLGVTMAAFALSAVPFLAKAWRRDRPVALLALPALYLRAWSLGLGFLLGHADRVLRRGPLEPPKKASEA